MKRWNLLSVVVLALLVVFSGSFAYGQKPGSSQELVDGIIQDVIHRTVESARKEVRRNTGIDPLKRGYVRGRNYSPVPNNTSKETRRELRKLNQEHDRKITQLEKELERKLEKAEKEFQREAAKEDKADKIREKRKKLQEKADDAYAKFEENIAEENARFDEKRHEILSKS